MSNEHRPKITLPIKRPFKNIFQFKITLLDTDPSVWRRIHVPESYTFYDLHVAIQDSMGWLDYHLHDFDILDISPSQKQLHIECPFAPPEYNEYGPDVFYTTDVPLKKFLKIEEDKAFYHYDYGDSWELRVTLEKILPRQEKSKYPICIEGKRAGPPEDCGGIPGYYRCIEVLNSHTDEDFLEWLGGWQPDVFNPAKVKFCDPRERLKLALDND